MEKRFAIAAVVTLVLVLAGLGLQRALLDGPISATSPSPAPSAVPSTTPSGALVAAVDGQVERRSADGSVWEAVRAGDRLQLSEEIRTGGNATAILSLGEDVRVRVEPESTVAVREITERTSHVQLDGGRLTATVQGGSDGKVRVTFRGSDAEAVSGPGEFSAVATTDGRIAVAAKEGSVALTANEETVEVAAGQQSVVLPDRAPAPPAAIAADLFLTLGAPAAAVQRKKELVVRGETAPGTWVRIGPVSTLAGPDGTFSATVPLREGANQVTVRATSPDGREQTRKLPPVTVDSKPLRVTGTVEWE